MGGPVTEGPIFLKYRTQKLNETIIDQQNIYGKDLYAKHYHINLNLNLFAKIIAKKLKLFA